MRCWPLGLVSVLSLLGGGCDALFVDNYRNCSKKPDICGQNASCNLETGRCETLDCMENPLLCSATQDCSPASRRCQTRTFVLGEPDALSNLPARYGLRAPESAFLITDAGNRTRLVVSDSGNQRVLIWNDVPTQNRPADVVLGMPDGHTLSAGQGYGGVNEVSMRYPASVASDGRNLLVCDTHWSRLLIYNQLPMVQPMPGPPLANIVWGQPSFDQNQPNAGLQAVTPLGVVQPATVFLERRSGGLFFVADRVNNRVLVFDGIPSHGSQLATVVLGQSSLFQAGAGTSASQLRMPQGVASNGSYVFVADTDNHRVLSYRTPLTSGLAATAVLGQTGFAGGAPNAGGAAASGSTLSSPTSLWELNDGSSRIFVADTANHRILRYTAATGMAPMTGQSADLVLGQPGLVASLENRGQSKPSAQTLASPAHVSSDGTRLVVSDRGNNRVLLWTSLPTTSGQPANVVLGQPDDQTATPNTPPDRSALQFIRPLSVATDGKLLAVADSGNNRVLLWRTMPQSGATPPDVVLGQIDTRRNLPNAGLPSATPRTLNNPSGVAISGGRLAVNDRGNSRVLLWNQIPSEPFGAPADVVLGQPDFTTTTPAAGQATLGTGFGVAFGSGSLYVADASNHRVVRFDEPLRNGMDAALVLGQPDFSLNIANQGGLSARSLTNPSYLLVYGESLLVSDAGNHRVLLWKTPPVRSHQAADVVLGQPDFSSVYTRPDRTRLLSPDGLAVRNGRLYVATFELNRILYWNQIPSQNGALADGVLGQTDFLATQPNNQELSSIERLSGPVDLAIAADQLIIADWNNNRVVVRGLP